MNPTATALVTYPPESDPCATRTDRPHPVDAATGYASCDTTGPGARTLAATGNTPWTALAGLVAVGFGVLLLVAGRRHDVAPRRSS